MSLRSIACNLFLVVFAAGCTGGRGGGARDFPSVSDENPVPFKISYFRSYPAPRTKKLEPTFRVVMSEGWRDRVGDDPRNPLIKAAPGKIFKGFMFDQDMQRLYAQLKEFEIEKLKPRDPKEWNFREMNLLAKHPQQNSFTRVITVGSDTWAKSYYYRDQQFSKKTIQVFVKCEAFVSRVVDSNSIQVRTQYRPLFRPER